MTANEELMSVNEEFQVANEELRASNEELEVSRRELLALNREVAVANAELEARMEELNRINNEMEVLFASSGIATIFLDRWLVVKGYSPAMAELLDLGPTDIGGNLHRLPVIRDLSQFREDSRQVMIQGEPLEREISFGKGDSIFIMRTLPYLDDGGQVDGIVITLIDVTHLKRTQQELIDGNRRLEYTNRELESFIYSISHDLRGPLRSIVSFSEILGQKYADNLDETGRGYLQRIDKGAKAMGDLIEDLLRLSMTSRSEMHRKPTDLSTIAAEIVADLREEAPQRRVDVYIQQGLTAVVDPPLFKVMLANLLQNAWKFTAKTKEARIEFTSMTTDGSIIFRMKDSGVGFDSNYQEKIFWPFHRLHSAKQFEGTGIGLAIAERIVLRHGGRIWADGREGEGATFSFTIGDVTGAERGP